MDNYRDSRSNIGADLDSIHNYYENLVINFLAKNQEKFGITQEDMPDIACVALNHLPPRYIRHAVDMAFYLSPNEYHDIEEKVEAAVAKAVTFVKQRNSE